VQDVSRGTKTEDGRQKTEDREQKTEEEDRSGTRTNRKKLICSMKVVSYKYTKLSKSK
jgi:hypothetical protein